MTDRYSFVQRLGQRLVSRGETVATAESCTGGLMAATLTEVAGSSEWFERGVVTYSDVSKQALLSVPEALIQQCGAVSAECARAMVQGLRKSSGNDWGIAVTGIAGPGGGTPVKPVGTVWIAWQYRDTAAEAVLHRFLGDRATVRQQALQAALEGLEQRLKNV